MILGLLGIISGVIIAQLTLHYWGNPITKLENKWKYRNLTPHQKREMRKFMRGYLK